MSSFFLVWLFVFLSRMKHFLTMISEIGFCKPNIEYFCCYMNISCNFQFFHVLYLQGKGTKTQTLQFDINKEDSETSINMNEQSRIQSVVA